MVNNLLSIGLTIALVALLIVAVTQWLHIPIGSVQDWLTGGAIFGWLLLVVTVPWNIHFLAKQIVNDAEGSRQRGIYLDSQQLEFARAWVGRSLAIALSLHFISALFFYLIARYGGGQLGYWGAGGALLLTFLRPIVSAYEYLTQRLTEIGQRVRYPREDVVELRYRLSQLEQIVGGLQREFNQENPDAWVVKQQEFMEETRRQLILINDKLERMEILHTQEIDRVRQESKQAISQLTVDSQFLEHVREIIRFFKSA
ncbi:MAG: hypothetical protein RMK91_12020 [Pseudanabaenaceae cyanobacterium SKYGB_i_bin29]|nr:hypothetical protein [Pseudanabaenaceae cyanobacterium SKYG29]MDW8422581.1 hypothetical protein [Pseudanabaenaceae cyanobacterium SKYGB_i_bin29]